MYRDESETLLDVGHSHNFATAFLRNLQGTQNRDLLDKKCVMSLRTYTISSP